MKIERNKEEDKKGRAKLWLKRIGMVALFITIIYMFETWGIVGVVIFILALVARRLWTFRENFKMVMQQIEMSIWGKPLDKDVWDNGELKNTKVKLVWGKGKMKRQLTNKHLSALFFVLFVVFFIIFAANKYTMNIIMSIICLQFSLAFKTWQIQREVQIEK